MNDIERDSYASVDHEAEGKALDIPKADKVVFYTTMGYPQKRTLLHTLKMPNMPCH